MVLQPVDTSSEDPTNLLVCRRFKVGSNLLPSRICSSRFQGDYLLTWGLQIDPNTPEVITLNGHLKFDATNTPAIHPADPLPREVLQYDQRANPPVNPSHMDLMIDTDNPRWKSFYVDLRILDPANPPPKHKLILRTPKGLQVDRPSNIHSHH
jgi:hypothetical protein